MTVKNNKEEPLTEEEEENRLNQADKYLKEGK